MSTFTGTSAAAAQVAGLVACLQGFSLQWFQDGTVLAPNQIRAVIDSNGFFQCGLQEFGTATVPNATCLRPDDDAFPYFDPFGVGEAFADWDSDAPQNNVGSGGPQEPRPRGPGRAGRAAGQRGGLADLRHGAVPARVVPAGPGSR